jgi:osmotically-inducible protein OsmY
MRILASALLALFLLLTVPSGFGQSKEDDRIYDQVRMRLANNPDVKGGGIEVKVDNGTVTLIGKVRTDKARSKAEQLTHKVKGVKKVINELQVAPT